MIFCIIVSMTENRKNDSIDNERWENVDKERIGLLKHISIVSLAAMAFIGGGYVEAAPCAVKFAALCFLIAVISSLLALILYVANFLIPRDSRNFFYGGEYPVYRVSFVCAIIFMFLGSMILGLVILFA